MITVPDKKVSALKASSIITCHKKESGWDQERIDKLSLKSIDDPSHYSHLPKMKNSLIVVHTVELGKQWKDSMSKELFLNIPKEEIGQIGGGQMNLCPVTVTTYQSLMKPHIQDALRGKIGTIIIDETHHGSAEEWNRGIKGLDVKKWKLDRIWDNERGRIRRVLVPEEYLPQEKRPLKLGLSATPTPFGPEKERMLNDVIGKRLTSVKDSKIVDAGYILPVRIRRKKIDPHPLTKAIHDSALIINADSRAHVKDVKADRWNQSPLSDITNLTLYKMRDEDAKREYRAGFNASGVMFDAAAMDENKLKYIMTRIAEEPEENFLVYSPRVLPLYFLSRGMQASGIDPPGCRVKLGEKAEKELCSATSKAACEKITAPSDGSEPCTWSEGTLPFIGKASRKLSAKKNIYEEMKKEIKLATEEERSGIVIDFVARQFTKLQDPTVNLKTKEKIVYNLAERQCLPNLNEKVKFTDQKFYFCLEEEPCSDKKTVVEDKEVATCMKGTLTDSTLAIYPTKAKRSLSIAQDKLGKVKRIIETAHAKRISEEYAQSQLGNIGMDKDANILKNLSDKLGGAAALKKRAAEIMTGSLVDEFLWRNLDYITITKEKDFDQWLKVGRIKYDGLIDYAAKRRIKITKTHSPGAVYPFSFLGFIIWGERIPGSSSVYDSRYRGLLSAVRYQLLSNMRHAVNRSEMDLANFFKDKTVTSKVLKDFAEGKTRVLPTTYKEGIDIPNANNLIISSVYTKPKDVIQLTGRIKRIADGKEPGEALFTTLKGTVDERYFRSSMRNLITDIHNTEHGEEIKEELKMIRSLNL